MASKNLKTTHLSISAQLDFYKTFDTKLKREIFQTPDDERNISQTRQNCNRLFYKYPETHLG